MVRLSIVVLFALLTSCKKDLPELKEIDLTSWKKDKNGCMNNRASMKASIIEQKSKLLALSELEVVELLGKPDQNELSKRNQKFYYYFLDPSKDCNVSTSANPSRLIIRFNAMGLAKEVDVQ